MSSNIRAKSPLVLLVAALVAPLAGCPPRGTALEPSQGDLSATAHQRPVRPLEVVRWTGKPNPKRWQEFDRLVGEQKYQQATKLIEKRLAESRANKRSEQWTRALIRHVKLRTALHGYEKAVRWLKEQPWPEDLLGHTVLNLYYASTLVNYAHVYSWEIRQRERVASKGHVDLKAWTLDQIYAEAQRAYEAVWLHRGQLGQQPITLLEEHLQLNDYPRKIRATLRDALTYLRVKLLQDTAGWRPEHENEIYQLDVALLLGQQQSAKHLLGRLSLVDPAVHPLLKVCAILDDLERWHSGRQELEAALEARLTRLRTLHARLTQSADRTRIRVDLRERLPQVKALPWSAMGMAVLAEFTRADQTPGKLVRAREIAARGRRAFPESVGGRRCAHIIKSIEAPDYQLQGMASDGPRKRSLGVRYKNLRKLHFRAYPIDLRQTLERSKDYNLLPRYRELEALLSSKTPSHQWDVALEQTVDYELHRADVTPPMNDPGYYLVVASARPGFGEADNVRRAVYISIGDLVLLTRNTNDGAVQVGTVSGSTGRPLAGVTVRLYRRDYRNGHRTVASAVSNSEGIVRLQRSGGYAFFLLAEKGKHVALDTSHIGFYRTGTPRRSYQALVYSDRSIYRPLQTLHFKTVVYQGRADLGDFKVAPRTSVTVHLTDPNNQDVAKQKLTTNAYGSASGSFVIPKGRLLGRWQLRVSRGGAAAVRVEEYKRPTFEAKLLDPKTPLRLNKPAALVGEARYLFGLPVTSGKVKWRVTRAPVYPWWWSYGWWGGGRGASTQIVDAGITELSETGAFTVRFTPQADERLASDGAGGAAMSGVSYRYAVSAEITDEGGESRTATRTFRLGFVAVQAEIALEAGNFLLDREAGKLTVRRTTLDGVASPGQGSYRLVQLTMPNKALLPADQPLPAPPAGSSTKGPKPFRTRGDAKRPRWSPRYDQRAVLRGWADGAEKARGKLTHDKKGEATVALPKLAAGAYRLHYTTRDAFGAEYRQSRAFIVAGPRPRLALPAYLMLEQTSVKVGQTARLFVGSGLAGQRVVLDFYRAGKHTERRVLESGRDSALIEIPVTERHRGGFGVTMTALRDHQLLQVQQSVFVPWDNKQLEVSFSTFRDRLRPGAKEKWTVKVTGPAGKKTPVRAAEVLAYMYDRSLNAFAPHNPPSPISLFPSRSGAGGARATLGGAPVAYLPGSGFASLPPYPTLRDDALRFLSGYGIGGLGRGGYGYGRGMPGMRSRPEPSAMPAPAPPRRALAPSRAKKESKLASANLQERAPAAEEAADKEADASGGEKPAAGVQLRQNFSETAFFEPHLLTGADGSVSFEFSVPDSVTSWNVWAHAITRDLSSGSVKRESRTVKELMVRPYLPRFLREDDRATIKVVVNNASDKPIAGTLAFDIIDPATDKSVLSSFGLTRQQASARAFSVRPNGGTNLSFPITTPAKVGLVAFRVIARSKTLSDGELRPLPVLPGRMHLAQSRFVTLKDKDRRELSFADLKRPDPTRINEQMVVTIDAQLFYSVLTALPYLVNYPYECTEQTLNRFISTGILASMYKDYPAVERMAKTFATRKTQYERWDSNDPNRKMALEETPWLQMAQGGPKRAHPLINVLDPRITRAQRDASLAKLGKAQTSLGAFPWFPGGPPSPYMTLYILHGFSKGLEFGVDLPKGMIQRAWRYMHRHYVDEIVATMLRHDCCWEFITFLNYVLSNYPDPSWTGGVFSKAERDKMLAHSFRHWKSHSPYLKAYLALTLHRAGRTKDAELVWASVMDSAQTKRDQGTFWAPEARSWLWYNDRIETHAFAVRTVMELLPASQKSSPALDGLVLWLFLNKKLNHWKSTRATAEVIYSLAHYLKRTAQLGAKEEITVTAGDLVKRFEFSPDRYTGKKNQLVIPGPEVDPKKHATIVVSKQTKGYAFASATWHFSTAQLPKEPRGDYLHVSRRYFKRVKTKSETKLVPLDEGTPVQVGDEVEVQIALKTKHPMEYVHLRDPRPAGFEPVSVASKHEYNLGIYWYEEIRDSGTNFFFERLPHGEYPFKYRLRATMAGAFKASPATVQPMYAPEFTGYSSGRTITIH